MLNPTDLKIHGIGTLSTQSHSWEDFYPDASDPVPTNMPKPRGHSVSINCFVDSDHAGDLGNRRSHSGVVIYLQSAPIIWYSKKQTTIETSTHARLIQDARLRSPVSRHGESRRKIPRSPVIPIVANELPIT